MRVYKRSAYHLIKGILAGPLAAAITALGVYALLRVLQWQQLPGATLILYSAPALVCLAVWYLSFFTQSIHFTLSKNGILTYYKLGRSKADYDLSCMKARCVYQSQLSGDSTPRDISLLLVDSDGWADILDCSALGPKRFSHMMDDILRHAAPATEELFEVQPLPVHLRKRRKKAEKPQKDAEPETPAATPVPEQPEGQLSFGPEGIYVPLQNPPLVPPAPIAQAAVGLSGGPPPIAAQQASSKPAEEILTFANAPTAVVGAHVEATVPTAPAVADEPTANELPQAEEAILAADASVTEVPQPQNGEPLALLQVEAADEVNAEILAAELAHTTAQSELENTSEGITLIAEEPSSESVDEPAPESEPPTEDTQEAPEDTVVAPKLPPQAQSVATSAEKPPAEAEPATPNPSGGKAGFDAPLPQESEIWDAWLQEEEESSP